ncbi:MAG: NAD-dependent epimerase/dehydratase family protein [Gemmatimonadaceae bacterium]
MAASLPPLVLTGASGFIGRRVLHALARRDAAAVTAVARDTAHLTTLPEWQSRWRALACDLGKDDLPADVLPRDAVFLHLAASTGRLSPAEMSRVNVEGTRRVLASARATGARHLVFVSSIAAGFDDQRWYHYARAKSAAEQLVLGSGVPCSVVRPTMVFGRGSPLERALVGLATSPLPIVLGSGDVQVQPVHVDDVVQVLLALAARAPVSGAPLELGGRDRVTLRELLARIRTARGLPPRTPHSLPIGLLRLLLGTVEPVLRPLMPVTAGQLASFVNDSDATPHPALADLLPGPLGIEEMLTRGAPDD